MSPPWRDGSALPGNASGRNTHRMTSAALSRSFLQDVGRCFATYWLVTVCSFAYCILNKLANSKPKVWLSQIILLIEQTLSKNTENLLKLLKRQSIESQDPAIPHLDICSGEIKHEPHTNVHTSVHRKPPNKNNPNNHQSKQNVVSIQWTIVW